MPVGWGGGPDNAVEEEMTGDLAQYTKFFVLHGYDFDIIYKAGLWTVTVWGKREITPVRGSVRVADEDGEFHYEPTVITHLRDWVAMSEPRPLLNDALQDAYQAVKAKKYLTS